MSHYHSVFPLLLKNAFCTTLRLNEMLCTTLIKEKAFRQDRCLESFVLRSLLKLCTVVWPAATIIIR